MIRYVLGVIFDFDMTNVLLLYRTKNPYMHHYNGIGGKIEEGETDEQAMLREFTEETKIPVSNINYMEKLMKIEYPSGVELHVFYIVLNPDYVKGNLPPSDEGILSWIPVDPTVFDVRNRDFAGEGNLSYFIHYAILRDTWSSIN